MHLNALLLVATVVLLSCVDADSARPTTPDQRQASAQTFLRNGTNTNEEERLPNPNPNVPYIVAHVVESMDSKLAEHARYWEAFVSLELHKAGDNLLAHPHFIRWKDFVTKDNMIDSDTAIVEVLLDFFGEVNLARMLEAATMVDNTKVIASKLQEAQLDIWDSTEVHPMKLLERLGLDLTSDGLAHNPLFNVWFKYVETAKRKHTWSIYQTTIRTLMARHTEVDLARELEALKRVDSLSGIATRLQDAHIQFWKDNNVLIEEAFERLELHLAGDNLLDNPLLKMWYDYVVRTMDDPDLVAVKFLITRLTEYGLAKMLSAATMIDGTSGIVTDLQEALARLWAYESVSIKALFTRLMLHKDADNLLGNPLFQVWYKYVKWMRKKYPDLVVVKFLKGYFGDLSLAKMLQSATEVEGTKAIATILQKLHIGSWKENQLNDVFTRLELHKTTKDLLGNPLFDVWYTHVKNVATLPALTAVKCLQTFFSDSALANLLQPTIKGTESIAEELQKAWQALLRMQHSAPRNN